MNRVTDGKIYLQQKRYSHRGSASIFAPMVDFNIMAEVGDTPP